jgi:hypothetical protein
MLSIDDIPPTADVYRNANDCFLLLYELDGVGVFIVLPNAHSMNFIQVFDRVIHCENHINQNQQQEVVLFAYDENIFHWFANNINTFANLRQINIFCQTNDQLFVNEWISFYRHQLEHINFNLCTFDDLNDELLSFGLRYIRRLRRQFQNDNDIFNQLDEHYKIICETLENNAIQRATLA